MKKFEELEKKSAYEIEKEILKQWKKDNILEKTIENRKENFVFYDGPIYANAMPGIHHLYGKNIKDAFCKYKTMKGYRVLRKIGLDTHGLPIEVNVEKKLGFTSKADIEKFGVDKFNLECKKATDTNVADVVKLTDMMGQFIDTENPYITCSNDFIESEWWILKKYADAGLLYHSNKVLPYCTRCGTELSAHEVAQEYKEISVNTVYAKFKLKKEENTYFLVWTTTPWTLLANVALCVNPDEDYVKVKVNDNFYILASSLLSKVVTDDYEEIEHYKGKDLEYIEYEQLISGMQSDKKAFYVTCDTYVTMTDGTGIVHLAPAFGVDDSNVGRKYDLPIFNPVGMDGKYIEGPWKGRVVYEGELEVDIIKYLASQNQLFKKEKIKHNYPHCWRCKTPLLYYSKPAWYIKTTAYKDKIIEANKKINWYPSFVGEKRFANWLLNLVDWGVSRNRYWGAPLPVWTCSCGHIEVIGSIDELMEKSFEKLKREEIDLHRPYVDNIHIICPKCKEKMSRVSDVLDVWFDSGSMPFGQYHYPFENKELFHEQFPADFIAEGIDQTRGWFYVLLVISTFIMGESPFRNVLVNDLLLDAEGKKMSKSKGNTVEPFSAISKYGADAIRFYLLYVSPVWTPIKFDEEGLKEVISKFFNTFKNTYTFFAMYANIDEIDPRSYTISYDEYEEIDKWLLSKYQGLVYMVTTSYDNYDLTAVVRSITDFVSEDLSNWYIRRNRRRFWQSEFDTSKKAVYKVTYDVLVGLCKLIAPIASYTAEELYSKLVGDKSVHLTDFPVYEENYIDKHIEKRMDLVRTLIRLGRNVREDAKIKVRQPIQEALIDGKNKKLISDLTPLILEELNVKEVIFTEEIDTYMNYVVKPNFKVAGPIFGSKIKLFADYLASISHEEIHKLQNGEAISILIDHDGFTIDQNMLDIRVIPKEGFNVAKENNHFIILNTELTNVLIEEGIARELVSKVQQLRKRENFDIADRINLYYSGDEMVHSVIDKFHDYIQKETLALSILSKKTEESFDLNGHVTTLQLEKR